jgi:DNA-binding transcriptional LysR family regulator
MDPTLLRSFVVLARLGHLGRAAGELQLTKPAISYHLKELESAVKHPLFERSPTGMLLTAAGSQLLPVAQQALDALDAVAMTAANLSNRLSGRALIGLIGDAVWLRAPQVVGFLHRHHPDLRVHLHQEVGESIPGAVLEGRLTAGWVLGAVHEAGLAARTLGRVRLSVVGPRAWARQLQHASVGELADFPWVDAPAHSAFTLHRQSLFASSGRLPTSLFQADSERALYGIAAEGLALTLLREDLALTGQEAGDLAIWPGQVPDLHLRFVIPAIRRDEPIGQALFTAVLRAWGQDRGQRSDVEGSHG